MSQMTSLVLAAALPLGGGGDAQVAFTLQDPSITESSGLAASSRHPGIVYTHNDSDGAPQIFAVDSSGRTKAVFSVAGATARDWEGIAMGRDEAGRPALYIADIGDNLKGAWPYVTVYRVREPSRMKSRTLQATAFRFTYSDGARDAEAILIDPRDNRLYVASKTFGAGRLYRAPRKLSSTRTNVLKPVGSAHSFATDGAYAPDGSSFVIRGYFSATLYRAPDEQITMMSLPSQEQGESVTYTPDGRALLISSEGEDRKVWRVPLPEEALPSPAPSAASERSSGEPPDNESESKGTNRGLGLFVVVGAVMAAIAYSRRRK
ncbi:WD40 repeat domain-containing protein [Actinocorallia aurantiaca]|uniref:WD40 repeat domain-containing protein n=2 Tax=Actinocorallia aurantiaca TaxID=46204 RepID=A0ABP6GK39_9ACTN